MTFTLLEISKPDPPPWIQREREMRRLALLDADKDLRVAVEAVKQFQGENFSIGERGARVPRIRANEVVWVAHLEYQLLTLRQQVSRKHDLFQAALKSWSELQP
jgi:hypothetical protein